MGHLGHLLLLLSLLPTATQGRNPHLLHKGVGEPCEDHRECQSRCCVTGSPNSQKLCTPQTVFLKCVSWRKPNGFSCLHSSNCKSNCCVLTDPRKQKTCMARTFFFQCVSWKKPNGSLCTKHSECQSHCCLRLTEVSPWRCIPHSGILALCLPL
ncbi:PREDICTED: leucine-rich colipase-like protein 1 [Condylura cristata]|uniref:leucine-rich colipase-like protein 1 n=1 Tax=Condylura cristata TaxID=143302 RepID=UPI0006439ACB|nr:PREDICTED: leucine-rich colipase-like protein 1 [Condylura cristata]